MDNHNGPVRAEDTDWHDQPVRESMRGPSARNRRSLSTDDKRIRRRMRRSGAQEESMVSTPDRARLLQQIASAGTLVEQAQLVTQLDDLDRAARRTAAQERELQVADMAIGEAMAPVASRTSRATGASDWLILEEDPPETDHTSMVAHAALWFSNVPTFVRADAGEFAEQARGEAQKLASGPDAARVFTDYVSFLRAQSASGLDQIEQTTAPDGVTEKPTPLPPDTFDNFAPPVNDINAPMVGTETSQRAPAIQQAMTGDGAGGAPEQPGGHNETGFLTGPAPEPSMQGGGGSSGPEQPGGHNQSGGVPTAGGPGDAPQQASQQLEPADPDPMQPAPQADEPVRSPEPRQASSGLPMVQQTTDVHDQNAPTPLPTTVAFPWNLGGEADGMTGEADYEQGGQVPSQHNAATRKRADQWSQPNPGVQPNIANSPATTPPRNPGQAGSGAADMADPNGFPSFGDAHAAPEYTQSYSQADPIEGPEDVPVSMGGDNGQHLNHSAFASRKVASKQEMLHPDFQRGYKYAMKWRPGTPLVTVGSAELEAGMYAGLTDHPAQRGAWLAAHAALAKSEPGLGQRIAKHREFTHRLASYRALPTDGTYLQVQAATSTDLDTMAPTTSPSPTGDTPINGPGRPGPLDGLQEAAAPAGAAPYNGAEPFGAPVVPQTPAIPQGQPVHIPDSGMTAPMRAGEGLSPANLAFRRTVQANRLAQKGN